MRVRRFRRVRRCTEVYEGEGGEGKEMYGDKEVSVIRVRRERVRANRMISGSRVV